MNVYFYVYYYYCCCWYHQIEMLELEVEQQRIKSHKLLAEYEAMTRQNHEEMDEKVINLGCFVSYIITLIIWLID